MKKQYLWGEFAVVFLFLVLPPLFTKSSGSPVNYTFSLLLPAQAAIAFLLDFQEHLSSKETGRNQTMERFSKKIQVLTWGAITFGGLMIVFALFQGLAFFFPKIASDSLLVDTVSPKKISEWIYCIIALAVGAYYEEVIYRQFLPKNGLMLWGTSKWKRSLIECISLLLFAFAHRYLGWAAVCNALCCGALLRLCYIKTNSVYTGSIVHFLYNICMYLLLLI
jgi:membrane protease YdiL (CAAX protease family)